MIFVSLKRKVVWTIGSKRKYTRYRTKKNRRDCDLLLYKICDTAWHPLQLRDSEISIWQWCAPLSVHCNYRECTEPWMLNSVFSFRVLDNRGHCGVDGATWPCWIESSSCPLGWGTFSQQFYVIFSTIVVYIGNEEANTFNPFLFISTFVSQTSPHVELAYFVLLLHITSLLGISLKKS